MKTLAEPGPHRATTGTRSHDRAAVRLAVSLSDADYADIARYAKLHDMPTASALRQLALICLRGGMRP